MTTPGTTTEAVATELRAAMARKNLSRRGLAALMGVNSQWVQRRLTGEQSLTVEDVVLICTALDISPLPLLQHALTP